MSGNHGYVLDASVLVARVRTREASHEGAKQVLKALVEEAADLYTPAISLAEVAAALSRGDDNTKQALRAVQELKQLPGLNVVNVDETLGDLAYNIAAAKRIRGCDAVYVALALTLNATLITLDRQQRERSPKAIVTLTPDEVLAQL